MFKSLGNLIHRTPWWGLTFGGLFILVALVMFATPIHLLRLPDSGKTPAEKSAIKREINLAFGDRALTIAESVVRSMKSAQPSRIGNASLITPWPKWRVPATNFQEPRPAAAAWPANPPAMPPMRRWRPRPPRPNRRWSRPPMREAIEEARDDAAEAARKGIDTTSTLKSFDELLKSAKESEKTARESLAAIKALQHTRPPSPGATASAPSKAPPPAIPPTSQALTVPPAAPVAPVSPAPAGAPGAADIAATGSPIAKGAQTPPPGKKPEEKRR